MRRNIVAGNWKMNNTLDEGLKLVSEIVNMVADEAPRNVDVVVAPPFPLLAPVAKLLNGQDQVQLAAQNCHQNASGAYTGEVSVGMLKSVEVSYVILGHSERREYFDESSQLLAEKVDAALGAGLTPIFCCGEPLDIRENGTHESYVHQQIQESLFHLSEEQFRKVVIAYEPIWAIGTGVTASSQQAQDMHASIRNFLRGQFGDAAQDCSLLYGGSCKPSNAKELFAMADVDGGLIGGASLKSRDFTDIITSFPS